MAAIIPSRPLVGGRLFGGSLRGAVVRSGCRIGRHFHVSLGSVTLIALVWTEAFAAEMPIKYRGNWASSESGCPKSVAEANDRDDLLTVTRRGYKAHETSCSLLSVLKGGARSSDAFKFSCWSEGDRSTFNELWSLTRGLLMRRGGEYGEGTYKRCN
jgi:hypothetical protein